MKVTITNLQQINDGIVCGVKVRFKVIQSGCVLVEGYIRQGYRSVYLSLMMSMRMMNLWWWNMIAQTCRSL